MLAGLGEGKGGRGGKVAGKMLTWEITALRGSQASLLASCKRGAQLLVRLHPCGGHRACARTTSAEKKTGGSIHHKRCILLRGIFGVLSPLSLSFPPRILYV